jgi:hypothetical protein
MRARPGWHARSSPRPDPGADGGNLPQSTKGPPVGTAGAAGVIDGHDPKSPIPLIGRTQVRRWSTISLIGRTQVRPRSIISLIGRTQVRRWSTISLIDHTQVWLGSTISLIDHTQVLPDGPRFVAQRFVFRRHVDFKQPILRPSEGTFVVINQEMSHGDR